jgi:hypothetical protein
MTGAKIAQSGSELHPDNVYWMGIRLPVLMPALGSLALIATILSWGAVGYALRSLESVWQDRVEALAELHETSAPFYRVLPQLSELGLPVTMDSVANALTSARGESVKAWKTYLGTTLTEAEVALVNQTTGPVGDLHKGAAELIETLRSGNHGNYVSQVQGQFMPRLYAVAMRMEGLVALQQTVTRDFVAEARRRHQWARAFLIVSGVLTTGVVAAGMIARGRSRAA